MGKEDAGASMLGGIDDDFPYRKVRSALVASVAGDMEAARLVVDVRDPEAFEARVVFGEATGEKVPCSREAIEFQGKFGTLIPHDCLTMGQQGWLPLEPRPLRRHNGCIDGTWRPPRGRLG